MNQLAAENLHLWRGEQHVLRAVSLKIGSGQCLQVTGANGAGKTTLLRALCLLTPLEEGRVSWCGQDVRVDRAAYQSQLAYLGHDNGLKGDLTAAENLRFGTSLHRRVSAAQIKGALADCGIADGQRVPVRQMSAGQRRRVALARLLLGGAALWLLDEPGSNLDSVGQGVLAGHLERHLEQGGMAVVATHQPLDLPRELLVGLVLQ